ncbi:MAG: mechanosensitive ion channel [Gammaproteobacteria bacterium]|nr:mechanosensitive ion channel [Gammaproteobacteria bacterium]
MIETAQEIWGYTLITAAGGQSITVGQLASVLLLLVLGYLGSRFVGYLIGRRLATTKLRPDVVHIVKRIAFFAILVLVVITALGLLGIPLTAFAFATGAIAIGVGFGAQNIINNFISGWILMAERPIRIDDFIEIDNAQGIVERIGNRSTRVRRTDGVHLLVPNSQLLERTVVNWTLVDQEIRTILRVGVEYGSPVRLVAELLLQAVTEQRQVKTKPQPSIVFEDFGDNSLVFDAYFWVDVTGERLLREIRSDIRFRLTELFAENQIIVAFPQRDVHLDSKNPLQIHLMPTGRETAGENTEHKA